MSRQLPAIGGMCAEHALAFRFALLSNAVIRC
jgi:hypothetical protein